MFERTRNPVLTWQDSLILIYANTHTDSQPMERSLINAVEGLEIFKRVYQAGDASISALNSLSMECGRLHGGLLHDMSLERAYRAEPVGYA